MKFSRIKRGRVPLAVGTAASVVFLWLALKDVHFAELWRVLAASATWLVLPLLLSLAAFYWIKAVRWRMLLAPVVVTGTRAVFPAMMIGFAANNVLPAHLGELVRMYVLARQLGVDDATVLATIVVERVFDFLTVLLLLGLALLLGVRLTGQLAIAGYFLIGVGVACLLFVLWYAGRGGASPKLADGMLGLVPEIVRSKILRQLDLWALGLGALRRKPLLLGIVVTSLAQWILMVVCLYTAMLAVGIRPPMAAPIVLLALSVAALTLPSSPGYVGTIELCFVLALRPFGIDAHDAFAAAVFYHAPAYVAVTITGFCFLYRTGWTFSRLRSDARRSPAVTRSADCRGD